MTDRDLNKLMGSNLRKLRRESRLTQEQLADLLDITHGIITKMECGAKGIGKKMLLKMCKVLNAEPYMFTRDEQLPLVTNTREREMIYTIREAEKLGVSELIEHYCSFILNQARTWQQPGDQQMRTTTAMTTPNPGRDIFADSSGPGLAERITRQAQKETGDARVAKKSN